MIVAKLILSAERRARENGREPAVQIRSFQDMARAIAGNDADAMLRIMREAGLDTEIEFPDPMTVSVDYFDL